MALETLDVVNDCLATMGESPLNSLEDDHVYKAAAQNFLNDSNKTLQQRGWWFNEEYVTLTPDATSNYIYVPQDALKVQTLDIYAPPAAQRGKRLYHSGKNTYEWDGPVDVKLTRLLTFEDLPYPAADAVRYATVLRFQREYDADSFRYQQIGVDYQRAHAELVAEDVRNKRPNLLNNPSMAAKMAWLSPVRRINPFIPIR